MYGHIAIIGAGAIGLAIHQLIAQQDLYIDLWDKDTTKVPEQKMLAEIIQNAEVVFLCVPSWALRSALEEVRPYLAPDTIIVGISKGLEQTTGQRTDQVIRSLLPDSPMVLLSGPMLAREIADGKRAYAAVAAYEKDNTAGQYIAKLFVGTKLTVQPSSYPDAVALAGVLKNVYTLLLGIAEGLHYGMNAKGWLVARAMQEMRIIAHHLQLDQETFLQVAGLADFIATGFSANSNNHRAGRELALHGHTDLKSEGLVSFASLFKILQPIANQLPLLRTLDAVIKQPKQTMQLMGEMIG